MVGGGGFEYFIKFFYQNTNVCLKFIELYIHREKSCEKGRLVYCLFVGYFALPVCLCETNGFTLVVLGQPFFGATRGVH